MAGLISGLLSVAPMNKSWPKLPKPDTGIEGHRDKWWPHGGDNGYLEAGGWG